MLGVCTVAFIASGPGQTIVVSQFNTAFRDELGLSASALSLAYMVGTISAALPLVLLGKASDRFGPRRVLAAIAFLFGLACAATGLVQGLASLTLAFFMLRFLGQGGLSVVSGHALALWFERRLGTANGLKLMGGQLGFALLPAVALSLIDAHGWRIAYPLLGLGVWIALLPLVLIVARDHPEQVGQRLDGDSPEDDRPDPSESRHPPQLDADAPATPSAIEISPTAERHVDPAFTLREAIRTPAYWILAATVLLNGLIGTAIIFHAQPLLEVRGLDPAASAAILRTWSLTFVVCIFPAGWLADRFPPRALLPVSLLLLGAASILSFWGGSLAHAHGSMLAFGVAQALTMGVSVPTVARYFGRAHHGAIRGSISRLAVAGTGLGPLALGASLDALGSFRPGLYAFACASAVIGVVAAFLTRPVPPRDRA